MTSLPIIDHPDSNPLPRSAAGEPGQSKGTYAFVSLGCPKNLVDSEKMLGSLSLDGYSLVSDPDGADFVIVYQAEVIGGEMQADDDADAVEWFAKNNLPPLAFRATQKVLQSFYA